MLASEAIKKRVSCRTYRDVPLADRDLQKLRDFLLTNLCGPFGNRVRFGIFDLAAGEREEIKNLATYGFIKGARTFIVGAVAKGDRAMQDYGYCMERNILGATHLGLGTCWLGGTFNRSASVAMIGKREDEVVPAITPVGYPLKRRSLMDALIRFSAKSSSRKAWEELFFSGGMKTRLARTTVGAYELPLDCVRVGPSASNRQPWRIIKEEKKDIFHFHIDRTPGYSNKYPGVSLQDVDMGIAMCHFEVGVLENNQKGNWKIMAPGPVQGGIEYVVSWVGDLGDEGGKELEGLTSC